MRYNAAMPTQIRYATARDKRFWFSLDAHIAESVWKQKLCDRTCYVLEADGRPAALLRYSLFWDNTPFCNLLYVAPAMQHRGYGSALLARWERDMRGQGYRCVLTSTQSDESAQHFYRKHGYKDAGGFVLSAAGDRPPLELVLEKAL